jgi:hypothetical protein
MIPALGDCGDVGHARVVHVMNQPQPDECRQTTGYAVSDNTLVHAWKLMSPRAPRLHPGYIIMEKQCWSEQAICHNAQLNSFKCNSVT